MLERFCSFLLAGLLLFGFLEAVRKDFQGKKAQEPTGFSGFLITCLGQVIATLIFLGAGAFDSLIRFFLPN